MKILPFSILSILIVGSIGVSSDVFAVGHNQICIDKVWIENTKGRIACVTPSTAEKLVERGWGTLLDDAEEKSKTTSSDTDQEITALKSQIEVLQQKINQYELEQTTVQKNLDLFDELDLVAFNERDMERITEIHMPDVKVINRDGKVTEPFDPDHKAELEFLFNTFPDFSINEHPIGFGQGNWTAGLSISTGTFLNPMELPNGTIIEPTGESFEVRIVTLAKWHDGRIVEEYLIWDNEDWMRQLGIVSEPVEQIKESITAQTKKEFVESTNKKTNNLQVEVFKGEVATVNSYIFSNGKSIIVMDVQRATSEAKKLAEAIKSKNLPLTHILISHGHPDHYIGMDWLLKEFPHAKIVVANEGIKQDAKSFSTWMESVGWLDEEPALKPKSEANPNGFDYDNSIHVLSEDTLTLDGGGTLELNTNYKPAESEHITTIYSKDMNALFMSDFGYNGVHLWMGTGVTKQHIANWKTQLEELKSQYTDINPTVYPGHGDPADVKLFDTLIQYIDDFNSVTSEANSKEEAEEKMRSLYPDYKEADFLLKNSVDNHIK